MRAMNRDTNRTLYLLSMGLFCTLLVAVAWPSLVGRIPVRNDLSDIHLPLRFFYAEGLKEGSSITWSSSLWSGLDLHAEGEGGFFHPLHLLLYRFLPFSAAFSIEAFLPLPLMFFGALLLFRRLGLSRGAAGFSAFLFVASGWSLRHLQYVNVATVFAHLPWLLLALRACASQDPRRRARGALALSLLTASELLLGFPQGVWFNAVAEGIFVGWLLLNGLLRSRDMLTRVAIAKILGILGGAIQVLPSLDAASHSVRSSLAEGFWTVGSLPPLNLAQPLHPYLFQGGALGGPREYAFYGGAASTVLLMVLIFRIRKLDRKRRALTILALALIVIAAILALGKYAGVYTYLGALPGLRWFRYPARFTCIVSLGVALASGIALDHIARSPIRLDIRRVAPMAGLVLASATLSLAGLAVVRTADEFAYLAPRIGSSLALLSGPLLVAAASLLVIWASRGSKKAYCALALFAAADLASYGVPEIYADPPMTLTEVVDSLNTPPNREGYRVASHDTTLLLGGWKLAGGNVALRPATRLDWSRETHLRVSSAGWRYQPVQHGDPRSAAEGPWYVVSDPLPRARVVTKAVSGPAPYPPESDTDPAEFAWLDEPLALGSGSPGTVEIRLDRNGAIDLEVTGPARQLAVISERWHPDWEAKVDGARVDLHRVDGDYMGVVTPGGKHLVSLRYRSKALRSGAAISLLALLLAVTSFIYSTRFRRHAS